jgi:hypothetical protein
MQQFIVIRMKTFDEEFAVKILKTAIDGTGAVCSMDTVEYQGEFWLVPSWLEAPWNGWRMPSKIVSLSRLGYEHTPDNSLGDFKLLIALEPSSLTDSVETLQANGYVVRERPDIRLPLAGENTLTA